MGKAQKTELKAKSLLTCAVSSSHQKAERKHLVRADLHFHTCYSPDATNPPKTIVEKLNNHPTIKALAITDHNTLEGYRKTAELAKAYPDILIIPGVEISAEEGEVILLGVSELPPEPWTARNIVAYSKAKNALAIAPHPYRGLGLRELAAKLELDAIETLNGITPPNQNRKAEELAKTRGLPGVAGSDSHFGSDPWNVYTEIQASLDVDDVLEGIRRGNVRVSLTEKSIHF
jgi:predicted metal-dependent phosphoesterase TrpH